WRAVVPELEPSDGPERASREAGGLAPKSLPRLGQYAESRQDHDYLPDARSGQKLVRLAAVTGITGSMVVDAHPSLWEHIEALDGVDRRTRRHLERRAAVRRRGRDALPPVVDSVLDPLSALAEQGLDCLHLGVRRPENPNTISHLFLLQRPKPGASVLRDLPGGMAQCPASAEPVPTPERLQLALTPSKPLPGLVRSEHGDRAAGARADDAPGKLAPRSPIPMSGLRVRVAAFRERVVQKRRAKHLAQFSYGDFSTSHFLSFLPAGPASRGGRLADAVLTS